MRRRVMWGVVALMSVTVTSLVLAQQSSPGTPGPGGPGMMQMGEDNGQATEAVICLLRVVLDAPRRR
jgi:hypothetical protein